MINDVEEEVEALDEVVDAGLTAVVLDVVVCETEEVVLDIPVEDEVLDGCVMVVKVVIGVVVKLEIGVIELLEDCGMLGVVKGVGSPAKGPVNDIVNGEVVKLLIDVVVDKLLDSEVVELLEDALELRGGRVKDVNVGEGTVVAKLDALGLGLTIDEVDRPGDCVEEELFIGTSSSQGSIDSKFFAT